MTVIDTAPAPTTIHLSGDIDIFTTSALRTQLRESLLYSTDLLVLDLSEVSFCDAGGLGVLLGIQANAREQGITLALTGLRPRMIRLLAISGLEDRFPIVV